MDGNAMVLNGIYQNTEMEIYILEHVLHHVRSSRFKAQLQLEFREFALLNMHTKDMLVQKGYLQQSLSTIERFRIYAVYAMELMRHPSTGQIAALLIQENMSGVMESIRLTRAFGGTAQEVSALASRLRHLDEYNIERLKAFL